MMKPRVALRLSSSPPVTVEDVESITCEVGGSSMEIRLLPDGSINVVAGGLNRLTIEPVASNSCVIRERA